MKTIQVRNVPDDVHRELRTRAARAGMSLSDYALEELIRTASRPSVADVLARSQRRGRALDTTSLVDMVRQARESAH